MEINQGQRDPISNISQTKKSEDLLRAWVFFKKQNSKTKLQFFLKKKSTGGRSKTLLLFLQKNGMVRHTDQQNHHYFLCLIKKPQKLYSALLSKLQLWTRHLHSFHIYSYRARLTFNCIWFALFLLPIHFDIYVYQRISNWGHGTPGGL